VGQCRTPLHPQSILVEGASDQVALESLARRQGRDLHALGVTVVAMGGAQAVWKNMDRFVRSDAATRITGLCDSAEAIHYERALRRVGLAPIAGPIDLSDYGVFVRGEDLEDELIRALDQVDIETLMAGAGDLRSFRTMQKQPQWNNKPFRAQMRRWIGAGSQRKGRYAQLMTDYVALDRVPAPLLEVLGAACSAADKGAD
jgi:hypothetical protein